MNRKFASFILLLFTACFSLTSCLNSDDEEYVFTHDTAITSFSLGTLTRSYHAVVDDKDTTLTASVAGSKYTFLIDQTTRQIYNPDSLPCGTQVSAVLATINSKNSSPIVLMNEAGDSIKSFYSSSDSIDFTKPRQFRVYNNDYSAYVTYTVTLNVHQEEADSFKWISLATRNVALAQLVDLKAVECNGQVYAFGTTSAGTLKIYQTAMDDGALWTEVVPEQALVANAYKSVVAFGGYIYTLSNGEVLRSTDAKHWTVVAGDASLVQLIGASRDNLYAYSLTGISVSKDGGETWQADALDMQQAFLPTENVCLTSLPILSTKGAEHLVLTGNRSAVYNDTIGTVWTKTVDTESSAWNYVEYNRAQGGKFPKMAQLLVERSDSGLVALGSDAKMYKCKDGGLTWQVDTLVTMPEAFQGEQGFAFFRDSKRFYWVINRQTGNVWKGRFNRDGWRKE